MHNKTQLKSQKVEIVAKVQNEWKVFCNEFGVYRPLLDFLVARKLEELLQAQVEAQDDAQEVFGGSLGTLSPARKMSGAYSLA